MHIGDKVRVIASGDIGEVKGTVGEYKYFVEFYDEDIDGAIFDRHELQHISYACWNTGSKAQTLAFLHEAERPDVSEIINQLAAIEKEDGVTDWDVAILDCDICGARQTSVFPHACEEEAFECHECHNMSARPVIID